MHDENTAERIRALRDQGLGYIAITQELGVSLRTVRGVLAPATNDRTPAQQERRRAKAQQRKLAQHPTPGELRLKNGTPVLVDIDTWDRYRGHRFWLSGPGYVTTRIDGRSEYLHRLILGLTLGDGHYTDHINRDKLDNRRANLRVVTQKENCANRGGYFEKSA